MFTKVDSSMKDKHWIIDGSNLSKLKSIKIVKGVYDHVITLTDCFYTKLHLWTTKHLQFVTIYSIISSELLQLFWQCPHLRCLILLNSYMLELNTLTNIEFYYGIQCKQLKELQLSGFGMINLGMIVHIFQQCKFLQKFILTNIVNEIDEMQYFFQRICHLPLPNLQYLKIDPNPNYFLTANYSYIINTLNNCNKNGFVLQFWVDDDDQLYEYTMLLKFFKYCEQFKFSRSTLSLHNGTYFTISPSPKKL